MSAVTATFRSSSFTLGTGLLRAVPYILMVAPYVAFFFLSPAQIRRLNNENGLFESIGALCFIVSAGFFLVAWWRSDGWGVRLGPLTLRRNIIYLGLGAALFLGAAEELSWGQSILRFPTPEFVARHNIQGEFNLHNLEWFHAQDADGVEKTGLARQFAFTRMATLFSLAATVALPVAYAAISPLRRFLDWMRIPAPALWIAPLLLLSYAAFKIAMANIDEGEFAGTANGLRMYEVREFQLAVIFVVIGITEAAKMKRRRDEGRLT